MLNGHGTEATTVIPPIYAADHLDPASPYTFDLAKADQLLDAAGYTKGPDGVRRLPGSTKQLRLRLFARQSSQNSQQEVRLIQGWFAQVGVPTDVKVLAEDNLTELIGQGNFDLFEWGWVVEPDPDYQLSVMTCEKRSYKDAGQVYANLSDSFYCNPAYDELYAQQATQTDPAQRARTVKQMQQLLYDDAALRPAVLLRRPAGLLRPVHRVRAAATAGRRAAVPVRHLELHPHRPDLPR